MLHISAFRALRPAEGLAEKIVSVPYDVVSREEAREMADGNPYSFLRVVRSDLEFPDNADPYGPEIYSRAKENFEKLINEGYLIRETGLALYIYQLEQSGHLQTGLVARNHVDDYINGKIKKHELTREDKENDRTRHIDALGANSGPVFLTFRSSRAPELSRLLKEAVSKSEKLYDITREGGVTHRIFRVIEPSLIQGISEAYENMECLYIADGHHRAASTARACMIRREKKGNFSGEEAFNWFLSVSFPDEELRILPYNRAVRDLNGLSPDEFLARISEKFEIQEEKKVPARREMGLYMNRKWYTLRFKKMAGQAGDITENLDVSILQNNVLDPILGIDDPRRSERIVFVGGIRGDKELVKLVDSGEFAAAFSMHPTSLEELEDIADAGKIMPPKSTWFEPKLCSGFLINLLDAD